MATTAPPVWEEWVRADAASQRRAFETTGRRPARLGAPPFADEATRRAALEHRLVLCDRPEHVGERLLSKSQRYGATTCKACTCAAQRAAREAARSTTERRMFASGEEWFREMAPDRSEAHPEIVGSCPRPERASFLTEEAYERANALCEERRALYYQQYRALPEHRDKENRAKRAAYASASTDARRARGARVQAAKDARMAAPLAEGYLRCPIGPHDAPREEFLFDPRTLPGLEDYRGDCSASRVRTRCRKHFAVAVRACRRHNAKSERKAYCHALEQQEHLKTTRRAYRVAHRAEDNARVRARRASDPVFRQKMIERGRRLMEQWSHRCAFRVANTRWSARVRSLENTLSDAAWAAILSPDATCFHCRRPNTNGRPLGPDRLDPAAGYTDENTVACCTECNMARGQLSMDAWHRACRNVATYQRDGVPATERVGYPMGTNLHRYGVSYEMMQYRAARRNLPCDLTREEYATLQDGSCYLCGIRGRLGADRQDGSKGYTASNVLPCCSCCNYLKRTRRTEQVVAMCTAVCATRDA